MEYTNRAESSLTIMEILAPDNLLDPYPLYRSLAEKASIFWDYELNSWVVTRYELMRDLLLDNRLGAKRLDLGDGEFPSSFHPLLRKVEAIFRSQMIYNDFSELRRLKRPWSQLFVHENLDILPLNETMSVLLENVHSKLYFDLLQDLAIPFVSTSINQLLGFNHVYTENYHLILKYADLLDGKVFNIRDFIYSMMSVVAIEAMCSEHLLEILSGNVSSPTMAKIGRQPGGLSLNEMAANLALIVTAGHESIAHLIANCVLYLYQNKALLGTYLPDAMLDNIIDEALRVDSPVQVIGRVANADFDVEGASVFAGDKFYFVIGCAK